MLPVPKGVLRVDCPASGGWGDYPSGCDQGRWGDRMKEWGYPPHRQNVRYPPPPMWTFCCTGPHPPRSGTNGEGWGSYAEAGGIPLRAARQKNRLVWIDRSLKRVGATACVPF